MTIEALIVDLQHREADANRINSSLPCNTALWWRALMRSWAISARLRMLHQNDRRLRAVVFAIAQAQACRDRALALEPSRHP